MGATLVGITAKVAARHFLWMFELLSLLLDVESRARRRVITTILINDLEGINLSVISKGQAYVAARGKMSV